MTAPILTSDLKLKSHTDLNLAFTKLFKQYPLSDKTQSLKIGVLYNKHTLGFGFGSDKYLYYDLASLTKVIFSVSAIYNYESAVGPILDRKVVDILHWFKASSQITVKDLLAHQSGAPALFPVYKSLQHSTVTGLGPLNLILRDVAFDEKKVVYSDVGFFILGAVLEQLYQKPLYFIFEHLRTVFPMGGMHFNILRQKKPSLTAPEPLEPSILKTKRHKSKYAPTEKCPLRQKIIQSEVHDENCWRMGGVGPHAGLFGTLQDVMIWLKAFKTELHKKNKLNSVFLKKQKGDWRSGVMVPSRPLSSCGQYFSDQAWGHLGFTGTSFWVDPMVDLSVVILSHRTYPSRDNKNFNVLRPLIHDTVYSTLISPAALIDNPISKARTKSAKKISFNSFLHGDKV